MFSFGLLFVSGSFAGTCCFVLNEVVADKESRMRETLRIMSLNRWSYALSYFIKQGIFAMFTSIVLFFTFYFAMTVNLGKGNEGVDKNFRQYNILFWGFVLFGLNIVSLSMVLSTMFTDSKLST